jgi:glycosyltransferase involved in cell wall biosynthesis
MEIVSICIPTYNRRWLLARAISSSLAQSYPNIEIIVSDNASTDDTQNYCKSLQALHTNFNYFRQPINRGPRANIEFLCNKASGRFMMILADDDFLDFQAIELMAGMLRKDSRLVHVGCHYNEVNPDGTRRILHSFKDLVDTKMCLTPRAINDYSVNSRLSVLFYGLTVTKVYRELPKTLHFRKLNLETTLSGTELVFLRCVMLRGSIGVFPKPLISYTGPGDRGGQPSLAAVLARELSLVDSFFIELQRYLWLCWLSTCDKSQENFGLRGVCMLTRTFTVYISRRFVYHLSRFIF